MDGMREIKFKAWLKNEGIMLSVYVLDQTGNAGRGTHFPKSKGFSEHGAQFVFNIDDAELRQFTGLLDKNGKEIYEGDILRISNFNMVGHEDTQSGSPVEIFEDIDCEVSFEDGGFCFIDEDKGQIPLFAINEDDYEILGNIYQNPDLLK